MREVDVRTDDGRVLHAYDMGPTGHSDELVVLWNHGTPNTGAPPEPLFDAARSLGIRWIGYDRPGYRGSSPHVGATIASAAADARQVADRLGINRFAVFGHSGGGPRALACAALLPDRVLAAVTISTPAPWPADGLDYFEGMSAGSVHELQAAARGRAALKEVLAANEFDPESFTPADYAALEGNWSWFTGIVQAATADGPDGMVEDNVIAMAPWGFDLPDVTVPTLIMHGTDDRMVPSSHGEWLAAHCPAAELRLEQGEGHISVLASARSALAWLRQVVTAWPDGAPIIGATAEMSRSVTDTDIALFTEISGDRNPLHYDLDAAKATRFGEIVVQGGVTSAILNAVAAEKLPGPGTVFLNVNWDFRAPVRPGDTITGRVEITDVRADKPITKLRTSVTRDDGVVAVEGTAVCYTMPLPRMR
jgi:pimeloyl-ACP methyl ester carboxylesterase/acyl-coenzyme A thioesterase PaaI-like protein